MHSINYMHRDIKPENILLQSSSIDEEIKIKLADLGLAKRYDPSSSRPHTTYVATRWYRSPEILLRITDYSFPSDLWAIGAVMAEFVSLGEPLFPGDDEKDQLARVVALRGHPSVVSWKKGTAVMQSRRIKLPKVTSSSLKNAIPLASLPVLQLISDLLEMDPACRPSASEALEYPLFLSQMTDTRESTHIRKRQKLDSREWDTAVSRDFPSSRLSCGSDDIQGALNFQSDVHNQMQVPPGRPQKPCHSELYGNKTTEESSMCFNIPQRNSEEKERSYGLDQGNMGHRQPAGQFNMRVTD